MADQINYHFQLVRSFEVEKIHTYRFHTNHISVEKPNVNSIQKRVSTLCIIWMSLQTAIQTRNRRMFITLLFTGQTLAEKKNNINTN